MELPEGTHYNIGKYGLLRWEYLKTHRRGEYIRLLLDGKLNEYLHEIEEECYTGMELLVEQMKADAGHNASHFKIIMQDNLCYDIILIIYENFVVIFQGITNH